MTEQNIKKIVIVGGGTAGWMTAAALAKYIRYPGVSITLVESDEIGTVGVGEATIPGIREFNQKLGIDEQDFMRSTQATIKLGIEFSNWSQIGDKYMHPFGFYGHDFNALPFYHYWLKQKATGDKTPLSDYSIPCLAAKQGKFRPPNQDPNSVLSTYFYAYHLDAGLYANYLRRLATAEGVMRIEGKITDISTDQEGKINNIKLANERIIDGELFIDCSGFSALLIEKKLACGFNDWSKWLPADSAIAVPSEKNPGNIKPYTQSIAHDCGWQWQIPLQHRTGNGIVYSTQFIDDAKAETQLLKNIDTPILNSPKQLKFKTGMRKVAWSKNCVAIGLSAGFVEPLESTSIHLIQSGIMKLINLFPDKNLCQTKVDEYNRQMNEQFEQVRDFIILHYKATQRTDSEFWRYCSDMPIPDSLSTRLELYKQTGQILECSKELFVETNWVAVLLGQHIIPKRHHPRADNLDHKQLQQIMLQMRTTMANAVSSMPNHIDFINQYCPAKTSS